MNVSTQARRAAVASFAIALIAASCALPGYEVGESSSSTTATGSTASAGGSQTSTGTGGAGGVGQGGEGGTAGAGGAGGMSPPECPAAPPPPETKCAWPQHICLYPTTKVEMTCCDDEYKCVGEDPSTAVWTFIDHVNCPSSECPQVCFPGCPDVPPMMGCRCRADQAECIYNTCGAAKKVLRYACSPQNMEGTSTWVQKGANVCCGPNDPPCPSPMVCTMAKDTDGTIVSFCK